MTSRRFKSEFLTLASQNDSRLPKTYHCFSLLDHQHYTIFKTSFDTPELRAQTLKVLNKLSQIYHSNILRYYNAWCQPSKKDPDNERYFFQLESRPNSLFNYLSTLRKAHFTLRSQDSFLKMLLGIYIQVITGISELFKSGLRQTNLLDFNDVYINRNQVVKLGEPKNLEFVENEEELAGKVLNDIEAVSYKLFYEENPFFRAGKRSKNKERCEILVKVEDFFARTIKSRNRRELLANMLVFFEEMIKFADFLKSYNKEETIGTYEFRLENQESYRKMVFKICGKEIRCYNDQKDRKPERIFKIKEFQVDWEENDEFGVIAMKNQWELGCCVQGTTKKETRDFYLKINNLMRRKS